LLDLIVNSLRIPVEKDGIDEYLKAASIKTGIDQKNIRLIKILSKALDTSSRGQFYFTLTIALSIQGDLGSREDFPVYTEKKEPHKKLRKTSERPIIIGFGPAGIFAALELIECGIKPVIFERGKPIEERTIDVQRFIRERELNPESNIQFGEGGAGSFSDGKLFARVNNSRYANKALDTFIKFGAPSEIKYIHKPHLGTDVLCRIVINMRNYILEHGGEIHYGSKMTDLIISDGKAVGVAINNAAEYLSSSIYLALGNSSRDTFEMIREKGVAIEPKPVSVGVRVEHPAQIINLMRYGDKYKDGTGLSAATYSLNFRDRKTGRSVNAFCMCPGGEVINASSEQGLMVLNGMSYSARASVFSNAAIIVSCGVDDYKESGPLSGVEFQRDIEKKAFIAGGRNWSVPAQNMVDFLCGKETVSLNENSCRTGTIPADLKAIFPDFVNASLLAAFNKWKEDYPLFVSEYGILLGAETRTSSPVRIKRGRKHESINIKNLFPIGEGSGYAGGITSSAIDAIKAVESCLCDSR
jgi:uncharacterized FAD-dependent dehydrogenase